MRVRLPGDVTLDDGGAPAEGEAAEDRERRGGLAAEAALRTAEAGWGDEVDAVGGLADVREALRLTAATGWAKRPMAVQLESELSAMQPEL